jgi:hypothetical protein
MFGINAESKRTCLSLEICHTHAPPIEVTFQFFPLGFEVGDEETIPSLGSGALEEASEAVEEMGRECVREERIRSSSEIRVTKAACN